MGFFSELFNSMKEDFSENIENANNMSFQQLYRAVNSGGITRKSAYCSVFKQQVAELDDDELISWCRRAKNEHMLTSLNIFCNEAVSRDLAYKDENGFHLKR